MSDNPVFGYMPDGALVEKISLSAHGLTASFLTYGGLLQDLRLEGHEPAMVLGFDDLEHYLNHSPYFGAIAGRYANRIRDGHLEIDGEVFQLDKNYLGRHCLHGGAKSMGKRLWKIENQTSDSVTMSIVLADGEMGFPGEMNASAHYQLLPGGILDIKYAATSDRSTLCNFAHHSYFNLDGYADVLDHKLQIAAEHYIPVQDDLIPTGEILDVAQTPFDFRSASVIGNNERVDGIDHNFCLSNERQKLRHVATLSSERSGITMKINTTEPGLQVYDGFNIAIPVPGHGGMVMKRNAGIALEPQVWPDSNHHRNFPQALLRPGEHYTQHTQYVFQKEPS